jgi:hypothetical protein
MSTHSPAAANIAAIMPNRLMPVTKGRLSGAQAQGLSSKRVRIPHVRSQNAELCDGFVAGCGNSRPVKRLLHSISILSRWPITRLPENVLLSCS